MCKIRKWTQLAIYPSQSLHIHQVKPSTLLVTGVLSVTRKGYHESIKQGVKGYGSINQSVKDQETISDSIKLSNGNSTLVSDKRKSSDRLTVIVITGILLSLVLFYAMQLQAIVIFESVAIATQLQYLTGRGRST